MPILTFRSPVTLPLLRKGTPKPAPPDPRAYESFRVTQQFDDPDAINPKVKHNAVDFGNFREGDPIVAMYPGVAYKRVDGAGALGVVIDHGYGIVSEYWHLRSQAIYNGQPVNAGFRIGQLGSTGLGSGAHCHIEVKRNGTRIDPEPLMFGGFLVTPEDDDVKLKGKFLRHIQNRQTTLTVNSHVRAGVLAGDDTSIEVLPAGTILYPIAAVEGRSVGSSAEWLAVIAYVGGSYSLGYVHSSVVAAPKPIEELGGYTADDLEAAKKAGEKAGFIDAKTKAAVAVQGIRP